MSLLAHISSIFNRRIAKPPVRARLKGWRVKFVDMRTRDVHWAPVYVAMNLRIGDFEAYPPVAGCFAATVFNPNGDSLLLTHNRHMLVGDSLCFRIQRS